MKSKKFLSFILLLSLTVLMTACGDKETGKNTTTAAGQTTSAATAVLTTTAPIITETAIEVKTTATEAASTASAPTATAPEVTTAAAKTTTTAEPTTVIEPEDEDALHNPLTNEVIVSYDELPVRAFAVAIGNNLQARPQSGLSQADIIYEVPAEGGVSRYLAIFYGGYSEKIGPCRSARPYLVSLADQFSAGLAHVGGSNDALALLEKGKTPNLDEFANSASFWRSTDRKAPNNCYTSTENLLKWYDSHNYKEQYIPTGFKFMKSSEKMIGEPVSSIYVDYPGAKNSYSYNEFNGLYYRSVSKAQQIDPEGDVDITCSNVIVQYITSKKLDKEGRLEIDLKKGGKAIFFINGQMLEGTWARAVEDKPTVYFDASGEEMKFATGKTWIQLVDQDCKVKYE